MINNNINIYINVKNYNINNELYLFKSNVNRYMSSVVHGRKYCVILWASGNCGQLDLVIPLAHHAAIPVIILQSNIIEFFQHAKSKPSVMSATHRQTC